MNKQHLEYCSSDEWADAVKKWIIPGALDGVDLRDNVLEVGPGPGRTTEVLQHMTKRLTALEIDEDLARKLGARLGSPSVRVVRGDGTKLPFPDGSFTAAVSFTMLHHVPSPDAQDRLLAEVARVLQSGGIFVGVDSLDSPQWREMHVDDVCVPVDPATIAARLERAGFSDVQAEPNPYVLQFRARARGREIER